MNAAGTLKNELRDFCELVSGPRDRGPVWEAALAGETARILLAWQEAVFSDADDAALKRYFRFHLETLSVLKADSEPISRALNILTDHFRNYYAQFLDQELLVPRSYYQHWYQSLQKRSEKARSLLNAAGISEGLRDCLSAYLDSFASTAHSRRNFRSVLYLEQFLDALPDTEPMEEHLCDLLLRLNFNHLGYLAWYQRKMQEKLRRYPPGAARRFVLESLSDLQARPVPLRTVYHPDWPPLKNMLILFLKEEISKLPEEMHPGIFKLPLNLSVPQLAGLIRSLYEEGIFGTAHLSEIFQFFAAHFSSRKQENISPGSLSKNFYSVSQVSAAVLRDQFSKMIKKIDRHFFPV